MGLKELEVKIKEKADQAIAAQNQATSQELQKLDDQFNKDKAVIDAIAHKETERALDLLRKKEVIPAKLKAKSLLLKTKRDLIEQVFNQAKERFANASAKEYATVLKLLLKKNPLPGPVKVSPCKAKEKETIKALTEIAKANGLALTFIEATPQITGGFIAKQALIDLDYSVDTYFESIRKELEEEIHKELF